MIIDCHGHYTTAPKALEEWRNRQIAGIKDPAARPRVADLVMSDDDIRQTIEANQLKLMRQRGSDVTIFSPRASFMAHHVGDFEVSSTWAAICNELCYRVSQLFPDHFVPAAMLRVGPEGQVFGFDVSEFQSVAIRFVPDRDYILELLLAHSNAGLTYEECVGVSYQQLHEDPEAAIADIVDRYHAMAARCDAVVIVGSDYTDVATPTELSVNARIAVNLGAPVVLSVLGSMTRVQAFGAVALGTAAGTYMTKFIG